MKKQSSLFVGFALCAMCFVLASCENPLFVDIAKLYTVTFETNGGSAVAPCRTDKIVCAPVTQKQDAEFLGWYSNELFAGLPVLFPFAPKQDTTLYAKWRAKADTPYTVEHYKQNDAFESNLDSYILEGTETFYGVKKALTQAEVKNYQGFSPEAFEQKTISSDGSTVIRIYYDRIKVRVSFDSNGGKGTMSAQEFYYGAERALKPNAFARQGYAFVCWIDALDGNKKYEDCQSAAFYCDTLLRAVWNDKSASYKVMFYKQSADLGENYDLVQGDTQTLRGEAGTLTNAAAKNYEGFVAKLFEQEKIRSDGSTVVKIYYDRIKPTVSNGVVIVASQVANMDLSSVGSEAYDILVEGKISSSTLQALADKIKSSSAPINLDLSRTTGITEIHGDGSSWKSLFSDCGRLEKLILPNSLKTIGAKAFQYCIFSSVVIPGSVTAIGNQAFMGCVFLNDIDFGCGLQSIGENVFGGCGALTAVTFPESLLGIQPTAFYGLQSLASVVFKGGGTWTARHMSEYLASCGYKYTFSVSDPAMNAARLKNDYSNYIWSKN